MSCAQAHWVGSKPIRRVMQLKLRKPTMAIGYSMRMCARHVDSTNPGRSNLVFRSQPIPEAEMSNRLIVIIAYTQSVHTIYIDIIYNCIYTIYVSNYYVSDYVGVCRPSYECAIGQLLRLFYIPILIILRNVYRSCSA